MRRERAEAGVRAGETLCRRSILVAETSGTVRRLICAALEEEGFLVLEADSVRELLSIVAGMEAPLDLVIAGESLLSEGQGGNPARLAALRPGLRTVCLLDGERPGVLRGCGAAVRRPFRRAELLAAVVGQLDQRLPVP